MKLAYKIRMLNGHKPFRPSDIYFFIQDAMSNIRVKSDCKSKYQMHSRWLDDWTEGLVKIKTTPLMTANRNKSCLTMVKTPIRPLLCFKNPIVWYDILTRGTINQCPKSHFVTMPEIHSPLQHTT